MAAFFDSLAALGRFDNFTLAGLATRRPSGEYQGVYVHAKVALVDDGWCTIGSCNTANRSFYGDTELNASIWHAPTVRALRAELLDEHLGIDTGRMDDVAALDVFAQVARENAERRMSGGGAARTGVGAGPGDVRGIGLRPAVPRFRRCGLRFTRFGHRVIGTNRRRGVAEPLPAAAWDRAAVRVWHLSSGFRGAAAYSTAIVPRICCGWMLQRKNSSGASSTELLSTVTSPLDPGLTLPVSSSASV
jgi:hypothetical protein